MGLSVALQAVLLVAALAPPGPAVPAEHRRPHFIVEDRANVLSVEERANLAHVSDELARATPDPIEVGFLLVASTEGQSIEDFTRGALVPWGMSEPGMQNSVLFVVATSDRRVRIEVGAGLARRLDAPARQHLIDDTLLPAFTKGQFGPGLATAARAAHWQLANGVRSAAASPSTSGGGDSIPLWAWPIIVVLAILARGVGLGRSRGFFGSSGGGGSGGSGGSGPFDGGGSSGKW
jgi:uncharacterized protein